MNREELQKPNLKKYEEIISSDFFLVGPAVAFVWNNDSNWSVALLSKNINDYFGYDKEDFISGKISYESIIHPDDLDRVIKEVEDASTLKLHSFTHELYRIKDSKGKYKWIKDSTSIIYNDDDTINHYIGYIICVNDNIDEIHRLNLLLANESSKLKTLVKSIPDLVWMKDPYGIYLACNKRFEQMYGASEEEIIGRDDYDFVNKELADFFRKHDLNAINSDLPLTNYEELTFANDGHKEYVKTTKTKVLDDNNNIIGVLGIGRDFTQEKNDTEKIEEQKNNLETIFNTTKDGIAVLDLNTNFIKVNHAYSLITGLSEKELLQTSCLALTHPDDIENTKIKMLDLFKNGFVDSYEKRCVFKDRVLVVSINVALLPDKNHLLVSMKDVTSLKLFEDQAKLASLGEMIGNIAHQWRQPLSVITTMASGIEIKQEYGMLNEEVIEESMEIILTQANYLSKTIDDFRNFISQTNEKTELDIRNTLEKTISIVYAAFKNHDIHLITNIEHTLTLEGYENELIQSFINILNNARDAVNENIERDQEKLIFLETIPTKNDGIIIKIKDNGGGIPEDTIKRIFEPYFTTKHKSIGTGIGLSMTYKLLKERHNTTICVTNEEFDYENKHYKGASFEIEFNK